MLNLELFAFQAMSTWLQKQLVAFGKRLWTDREPIDRDRIVVPFPKIPAASKEREEEINTLSELSSITLLEDQVMFLPPSWQLIWNLQGFIKVNR